MAAHPCTGSLRQIWALAAFLMFALCAVPNVSAQSRLASDSQADVQLRGTSRADRKPPEDYTRLRFGMGVAGGGFVGDLNGGIGGLYAQFGVQFNNVLALFYQSHGLVGAFAESSSYSEGGAVTALWWNTAMLELTLGGTFQVGAGPSLDLIAGCVATAAGSGCSDSGPYFGIDGRVAVAIGGKGPGTRGGVAIGADIHPTFFPDGYTLALVATIGGQVY